MNDQVLGNRYKIINVLGAGGMGQTYIAEDTQRPGNPRCVVKQLKPVSTDPGFLATASRLFKREAEILDKLGHHDQIPCLFAHFEQGGEFYLVQEFIDGQTLSSEMPLGARWSEPQVVALLNDILDILEFIHGEGVIHRDIKPDNIIRRNQDGRLVLIDFGAVKQVRMQQTTAVGQVSVTVAIGTPGYMPTEQSSGKPRPSSDVYALGMVAIQALTGLLPSQLREDEDGEVIWRDQAEVSDGLATVLTMMTRHYFKHRYQSAVEVRRALENLESAASSQGYTPTQTVNNGHYTPTDVPPATDRSTPLRPDSSRQSQAGEQQRTDYPQTVRPEPSSPNRLVLLGAILLSALIGGGLIYSDLNIKQDPPVTIPSVAPISGTVPEGTDTPSDPSTPIEPVDNTETGTTGTDTTIPETANPWRDAINAAMEAVVLAQTAQTAEDWGAVAETWDQSVQLLLLVPETDPNYLAAQYKIVEYTNNLDIARARLDIARARELEALGQ